MKNIKNKIYLEYEDFGGEQMNNKSSFFNNINPYSSKTTTNSRIPNDLAALSMMDRQVLNNYMQQVTHMNTMKSIINKKKLT